jgi:hypothetical protein
MSKVINFSIGKDIRDERDRQECWEHLQSTINEQYDNVKGYILVTWDQDDVSESMFYDVNNMPEDTKMALIRSLDE